MVPKTVDCAVDQKTHDPGLTDTDRSKNGRRGAKRGWKTKSAKFDSRECEALQRMVTDLKTCVDAVIHEAVILHLVRNHYRPGDPPHDPL